MLLQWRLWWPLLYFLMPHSLLHPPRPWQHFVQFTRASTLRHHVPLCAETPVFVLEGTAATSLAMAPFRAGFQGMRVETLDPVVPAPLYVQTVATEPQETVDT